MRIIDGPTEEQWANCLEIAQRISQVLGHKLVSFFVYGAAMFPRPLTWRTDVDFHALIEGEVTEQETVRLRQAHAEFERQHGGAVELDGYYIRLQSAMRSDCPTGLIWRGVVDRSWALHRAHIHAGKYRSVLGLDPMRIVPRPTWNECAAALASEFEFVREHQDEAAYCVLNLVRILLSCERRSVVLSKYEAGIWALETLDPAFQPLIRAAMRAYEDQRQPGDQRILTTEMPGLLTLVEQRVTELGT